MLCPAGAYHVTARCGASILGTDTASAVSYLSDNLTSLKGNTMTTTTKAKIAPSLVAITSLRFTGKAGDARKIAFMAIAPYSFAEDASRVQSISNLRAALGSKPNALQIVAAKTQWVIGRVASRLPAGEFPMAGMAGGDRLDYAEKIILTYAAPAKDGAKPRALRSGQVGRRSIIQHRVIRNAEEAWSLVAAELAIGGARTMAEKNAKQKETRAPQMAGSSKDGAKPSHAELVKPAAPVTVEEARAGMMALATTALAYANKHGKLLASDYGKAARAFKTAIIAAEKADKEARGAAEAKAAELAK